MGTHQVQIRHLALSLGALLLCILLGASTTFAGTPNDAPTATSQKAHLTAPEASCATTASIITSPNPASNANRLNAVAADASNSIWAVGSYVNSSGISQTLIEHWNGNQWGIIASPNVPGDNYLISLAVASANDIWAVGYSGTAFNEQALTLHWDGANWSIVPSFGPGVLNDVIAISAGNAWAVGDVILHWNGQNWSQVSSPYPARLTSIDAVSANDIWAVGSFSGSRTVTLHWDGQLWSRITSPNPSLGYGGAEVNALRAVEAISQNDVWAVGYTGISDGFGQFSTMALHWDGQQWAVVPTPDYPAWSDNYLNAISASGPNDVWVAGSYRNLYTYDEDSMLLHWDGDNWSWINSPVPGRETLNGIVVLSAGNVWAVGTIVDKTLTIRWDGTRWNVIPSPNATEGRNYLNDVEVVSPNDIWAVGRFSNSFSTGYVSYQALIEHWNGNQWAVIPGPHNYNAPVTLNGISSVSATDIWAVGTSILSSTDIRTITLHWDGTQWSAVTSPSENGVENYLTAVKALSTNDVWAVGYERSSSENRPLILHWNGASWSKHQISEPSGPDIYLNSITAVSPTDIWAVGSNNARTLTMHYDGLSWSVVPSPNVGSDRNILQGVIARTSSDVWAVGYYGPPGTGQALILRWDGSQWNVVPTPLAGTGSFLFDIEAISANDALAVGNYLTNGIQKPLVERWDGSQWQIVTSPDPGPGTGFLFALDQASSQEFWAVGHYETGTSHLTLVEKLEHLLFSDVREENIFYPYIRCLVERNIISGYADCTFRPNNEVTRGQLSKIVSNSAGFAEDPGEQRFEDVRPTHTFYEWIQRLAARGHIGGYECGGVGEPCISGKPYFRPNANATRGQISKIVSNAAGYSDPPDTQTFEDVRPTHTFYEWIQRLATRNIMGGYSCGGVGEPCMSGKPYFRPQNNATRGQTSKIVSNTFFPECNTQAKP